MFVITRIYIYVKEILLRFKHRTRVSFRYKTKTTAYDRIKRCSFSQKGEHFRLSCLADDKEQFRVYTLTDKVNGFFDDVQFAFPRPSSDKLYPTRHLYILPRGYCIISIEMCRKLLEIHVKHLCYKRKLLTQDY